MRTHVSIAAGAIICGAAHADILYANISNDLYRIDTDAWTAELLTPFAQSVRSLAVAGADEVYAIRSSTPGIVYSIDVETGWLTPIADVGVEVEAIALDPVNDLMYAVTEGFMYLDEPELYLLDLDTGEATLLMALTELFDIHNFNSVIDLCFDQEGQAYVAARFNFSDPDENWFNVYELDLDTGGIDAGVEVYYSYYDAGYGETWYAWPVTPGAGGGFWSGASFPENKTIFGSFDPATFDLDDLRTFNDVIVDGLPEAPIDLALVPTSCAADVNGDGALDVLDFVAFQQLFLAQDPGADCNADDAFSILDFVCFQLQFADGCG